MNRWLIRLHLGLAQHRLAVAVALVCCVGLGVWGVNRLELSEDFTDMLPTADAAVAEQMEALRWLRQADRLYFDVSVAAPGAEGLDRAADHLDSALRAIPALDDVRSRLDEGALGEVMEGLVAEAPELLTAADLEELERRLEPEALRRRLEWFKKSLAQPQGMMLKDLVARDPIGMMDLLSERLKSLRSGAVSGRLVQGRLTSVDGRHVLLSALPRCAASDHRQSGPLVAAVQAAATAAEQAAADPTVRVSFTGAHRVALDNATLIREDLPRVTGLAALAVAVLMMGAFRRRWLALASLLPTALGALAAGAVFAWLGDPVSAIALGCGSCLVGVVVDCAVHVVYHLDDTAPADRESVAFQLARLTPSVAIAGLTTVAAFLIMLVSPTPGHRQLGAFAAVGAAVSAAASLVVLPLYLPLPRRDPAAGAAHPPRPLILTRWLEAVLRWRARSNRLAWVLVVVVSAVAVVGLTRFRFEDDVGRLNGVRPDTKRADAAVRAAWEQSLGLTTLLVSGTTWDEALARNERLHALLRSLQRQGALDAVTSVAPLCPSAATRAAARERWRQFWTPARQATLRTRLDAVGADVGIRPGLFQGFLESLAASAPAATVADSLPALLEADGFKDFGHVRSGRAGLVTFVKASSAAAVSGLREQLRRELPGTLLLNKEALGMRLAQLTQRNLVVFGGLALGVNTVLLWLLLGRVRLVLVALVPILAGNAWTLGALGLMGHSLNFANLVFVIFVAGVSLDYCMFMLLARLDPVRGHHEREASAAASVTLCALTTLAGVGALALARHPALFSVGVTALAGISLCLLATLLLVPSLMDGVLAGHGAAGVAAATGDRRRAVRRLYAFQGPYVEQFAYWKLKTDPVFDYLEAAVPAQACVVDIGCGHGLGAHWLTLQSPGRRVLGVDHDPEKLRVARATARANPSVQFEAQDILRWSCPACDVVLLLDVLHYLPDAGKRRVLGEVFRALRPGGRLVLRDAARNAARGHRWVVWSERWAVWSGHNRTAHGLQFATAEEHRTWLREAGFVTVDMPAGAGLGSNCLWIAHKPAAAHGVPEARPPAAAGEEGVEQ